jgi:TonB family protein
VAGLVVLNIVRAAIALVDSLQGTSMGPGNVSASRFESLKEKEMKFGLLLILITITAMVVPAQRPRATDDSKTTTASPTAQAPTTVKAKYEGGVFGYNKKQDGSLTFDDPNNRLVFKNKQQKEVLFIPYEAVNQAFADTKALRPTAASVVSAIPVPYGLNLPARFIKKKYQYLTMQFYDNDSHVGGVTSFKMADKATVASVLNALANKAGLTPRGEIFVKQRGGQVGRGDVVAGSVIAVPVEMPRPAVFIENETLSNRVISLPRPAYPEAARESKTTGVVRVLVTVDERGRVEEAEAVSGPSALQSSAVEAAKQAIFEPVIKDGKPAKMKAVIAYTFQVT